MDHLFGAISCGLRFWGLRFFRFLDCGLLFGGRLWQGCGLGFTLGNGSKRSSVHELAQSVNGIRIVVREVDRGLDVFLPWCQSGRAEVGVSSHFELVLEDSLKEIRDRCQYHSVDLDLSIVAGDAEVRKRSTFEQLAPLRGRDARHVKW